LKRILILTEGQTEEKFIKSVLQPHFWKANLSIEPKIVTTKRVIGGTSHKGGGDFSKIVGDIRRLLMDTNATRVTTLFDFYGFPRNVPNCEESVYKDIEALTLAIDTTISDRRFKCYLQRHEFEAFLFVDSNITAAVAQQLNKSKEITQQRQQFETVEDINLNPTLAPSKRIAAILGSYSKPLIGSVTTQRVGIDKLRGECPRFALWLGWMESLAEEA
jgi:hypothetical protein